MITKAEYDLLHAVPEDQLYLGTTAYGVVRGDGTECG